MELIHIVGLLLSDFAKESPILFVVIFNLIMAIVALSTIYFTDSLRLEMKRKEREEKLNNTNHILKRS